LKKGSFFWCAHSFVCFFWVLATFWFLATATRFFKEKNRKEGKRTSFFLFLNIIETCLYSKFWKFPLF
jgi:hypothetical protein